MRTLSWIGGLALLASVGCKIEALPSDPGTTTVGPGTDSGSAGGGPGAAVACVLDGGVHGAPVDGWLGDPTSPTGQPCSCGQPDGPVLSIGPLAVARALLPGRWLVCYRSSDTIGPWHPSNFVGLELVADDSVTSAPSGGGRWYFLAAASDGTIQRTQGFDGQGTFLYNPFPGPDWEQISLSGSGQYQDFNVAFSDGPRKMRLIEPTSSFTAIFVPLGP